MKTVNSIPFIASVILLMINSGCKKVVETPPPPNTAPISNAGDDQAITLPTNTITLNGKGSTDPDNNITSYTWTKISGPSSFNIDSANIVQTQVANLIEGVYQFELKVTDAGGLFSKDTMQVMVSHEPNTPLVDIYVAGSENNIPVYWKNGQAILLDNGPSDYSGTSIAVVGSDVGVAVMRVGLWWNEYAAKYWKNGQGVQLGNYAGATSIALSGSDVYVAGYEWENTGLVAKYWKNGQSVSLSNGTTDAEATSMAIVGNDVYVAGHVNGIAKYWKNGQEVLLTDGSHQAYANSIIVVGSDIYVAGSEGGTAKYWKNGFAVPLSQGVAKSIAVVGNDVYVAGYDGNYYTYRAKYWKNGQEVLLTNGANPEIAWSVAIHSGDVYIAVTEYFFNTGNRVAKYWKNDQMVLLSSKGVANSIVVVDH